MARDILTIPISTVASEYAFNTSGCILDAFRSTLSPKIVEALVFTKLVEEISHNQFAKKILEVVEKYEDITQGIIHKSFGLVIYIFMIYKIITFFFFFMFC